MWMLTIHKYIVSWFPPYSFNPKHMCTVNNDLRSKDQRHTMLIKYYFTSFDRFDNIGQLVSRLYLPSQNRNISLSLWRVCLLAYQICQSLFKLSGLHVDHSHRSSVMCKNQTCNLFTTIRCGFYNFLPVKSLKHILDTFQISVYLFILIYVTYYGSSLINWIKGMKLSVTKTKT